MKFKVGDKVKVNMKRLRQLKDEGRDIKHGLIDLLYDVGKQDETLEIVKVLPNCYPREDYSENSYIVTNNNFEYPLHVGEKEIKPIKGNEIRRL